MKTKPNVHATEEVVEAFTAVRDAIDRALELIAEEGPEDARAAARRYVERHPHTPLVSQRIRERRS